MKKRVKGTGPLNARIIIIGEAPGYTENLQGEPFKGKSGMLLNQWLREVGLDRDLIRIDNLVYYQPPRGNDIDSFPIGYLIEWIKYLHVRIAQLENPYVIVPMGNYPLFALTGKGKVKTALRKSLAKDVFEYMEVAQEEKKAGITKLRGSIYSYADLQGRKIKVIPTVHPAYVLYGANTKWEKRCLSDWRKIIEESQFKELILPKRNHIIYPSEDKVQKWIKNIVPEDKIALDIETGQKAISCVGFAKDSLESITLPLTTKQEKNTFYPYVKYLCECENEKILQNCLFDSYWLRRTQKIEINNMIHDIMLYHHAIDPIENHSLAFLTSIYTKEPYFKDDTKFDKEHITYSDLATLFTYNGKDCCVTREIFDVLYPKVTQEGMLDFYNNHYAEMVPVILDIMCHGMRVNTKAQKKWSKKLLKECFEIREKLKKSAGEDLYAERDFSPKKLKNFFYGKLGLPVQTKMTKLKSGKARTVTLDETALRKMSVMFPSKIGNYGMMVLKHREMMKESYYLKGAWDTDGRIRCAYKMITEAGRLSSSSNPMRTGYNLQNVKR